MSGIEDLRQRVQEAEARFGSANEEQAKYSVRLIGLIDTVEGRLRDQQAEIDRQQAALAAHDSDATAARAEASRLQHENEQIRDMLLSLLRAIEAGGRTGLSETMQVLEGKVSALMAGGDSATAAPHASVEAVAEVAAEPAPEVAAEEVAEPEPELEMPAEAVAEAAPEPEPEMAAEEVAEAAPEPEMDMPVEEVAEAAPEPEPEIAAEEVAEAVPEPEPEMAAEEVAEAAPEPELDMPAEDVAEAAPEPDPEPEMVPEEAAEAVSAEDESTAAALDKIAEQLAAAPGKTSPAESDSLHEIMDRVSKLVRETEAAAGGADTAAPAATSPAPAKKSAAG